MNRAAPESASRFDPADRLAIEVADLDVDLPLPGSPGAPHPTVRGLRLIVRAEAVPVALSFASVALNQISQERVANLIDQMGASVWLRPLRPTYALLFRLAGVENGLEIDGWLERGALIARARFRSAAQAGLFGRLRDRAKGAAAIRLRVEPSVGEVGRLRLRLVVEPDVGGMVTKAVVGALVERPGVGRVDDTSVDVDLRVFLAGQDSVSVGWAAAVEMVAVTPETITAVCGPGSPGSS